MLGLIVINISKKKSKKEKIWLYIINKCKNIKKYKKK